MPPSRAAFFDFDYTIVNRDSFALFIRFLFEQEPWRKALLVLFLPLILVLGASKKTHMKRNFLLVWISTFAMPENKLAGYQSRYAEHFFSKAKGRAYEQALEAVQDHVERGDDIYIISGAAQWILERLCNHLEITDATLIGTMTKWHLGGIVAEFHCYKHNKVVRLKEMGLPLRYSSIVGYSDSAADIPMLKLCDEIHLINPRPKCREKFARAFGENVVLHSWR